MLQLRNSYLFQNFRVCLPNACISTRTFLYRASISKSLISPAIVGPQPLRKIFSLISQKKRDEISARVVADRNLWSSMYYDPRIVMFQMFSRFKLYQTFFTFALILFCCSIFLNTKQDQPSGIATGNKETKTKRKKRVVAKKEPDPSDPLPSIVAGVALCSLSLSVLFAFNYYFRRIVGVLAVDRKTSSVVRIGHLSFWGKRTNSYFKVEEMEPLSESSEGDALHRFMIRWRAYPAPPASPAPLSSSTTTPSTRPSSSPTPTGSGARARLTSTSLLARLIGRPHVGASRARLRPTPEQTSPQDTLSAALREPASTGTTHTSGTEAQKQWLSSLAPEVAELFAADSARRAEAGSRVVPHFFVNLRRTRLYQPSEVARVLGVRLSDIEALRSSSGRVTK